MTETPLLELKGITKRFPGVVANDHVDFQLAKGEVHALLGENGAGKSTLMNILYGLYHPDEGEIRLRGKPVRIDSPRAAIDAGIGMVHQHFMLIPVMSVAENIVLAVEPHKGPFLDLDSANESVRDISKRFGLAVRPEARSRVDLGRHAAAGRDPEGALPGRRDPHPGRADGGADAAGGGGALRRSSARSRPRASRSSSSATSSARCSPSPTGSPSSGAGRRSRPSRARGPQKQSLARLMVGREVLLRVEKPPAEPGDPLLQVEDLRVLDERGLEARPRHLASRCGRARSSGIAGRGRERPDGAHRGDHRPAQAGVAAGSSPEARTSRPSAAANASTPASATSPRTASGAASSSTSRSPRTSRCTTTARSRTRSGAGSTRSGLSRARSGSSRSSTSAAAGRRRPRPRSRAATSRRSSSRGRSRATRSVLDRRTADPRARRRRDRVRPPPPRRGARRGPRRSCSSRSSWTRSSRSPTASSSSTRAGSSASTRPRSPRRSSASP